MVSKILPALLIAGVAVCMANPKLEVDRTTYDCGTVKEGKTSKVKASFKLSNTGTSPLKITDIRRSCGCTVVRFDSTIMPGKSTVIEPVVNISGFKSGPMTKYVTIVSNAENKKMQKLTIKAKIVPVIDLSETYIVFDQKSPKKLYLSTPKKDFKVKEVVFNPRSQKNGKWSSSVPLKVDFEFSSLDSTRSDDFRVYQLDLMPLDSEERVFGNFQISTNHRDKPKIILRGRLGN
ncbi:MAG: DUF1573 domain-containing protein [Chitinispirillaceae bacterium]